MKKQGIIAVFFFFSLQVLSAFASNNEKTFASYGPNWRVTYEQMGTDISQCAIGARAEQGGVQSTLQVVYGKHAAPPYALIYEPGHALQPGSHITFYVGDLFFVVYPPMEKKSVRVTLREQEVIHQILEGLHTADHLVVSTVDESGIEHKQHFSSEVFLNALAGLKRICAIRAPLRQQKEKSAFKRKIESFSKKRSPRKKQQAVKLQVNTQRILDRVYIDLGQTGWAKKKGA